MTRHKEANAAITHVRVSPVIKQRLQALRQNHNFPTIDKVLRYYLPTNVAEANSKPLFYTRTHDRIIKDAASRIANLSKSGKRKRKYSHSLYKTGKPKI
jgi:hypothetical protein